jgi:hypothetical protein
VRKAATTMAGVRRKCGKSLILSRWGSILYKVAGRNLRGKSRKGTGDANHKKLDKSVGLR